MRSRHSIYILRGIDRKTTCVLCFFLLCVSELFGQASDSVPKATPYRILDKDTLNAYIFKPASKQGDHPAILLFHGGAWKIGEAAWTFKRAREFAEKGMVAISIEYRLANNGMSPVDAVEDACFAFAWARSHAKGLGIDVKRVAGYGVSAGGHLVAAAALLPSVKGVKIQDVSRPNALLLFSPALNLAHDGYFVSIMAGKGNAADYSPLNFVAKNLPPTLIIQGERDSLVFAADAIAFRDLAVKAHARCELKIYPAVGHLLSRNLNIQSNDFDPNPADVADAHQREIKFLESLEYLSR